MQEESRRADVDQPFSVPTSIRSTSKKVTDHLANERTFLAWVRTGIAIMGFGFVVARFGLLLRELNVKGTSSILPPHISSAIGVTLTVIGAVMTVMALLNFVHIRRSIDLEQFRPPIVFSVVLTVLVTLAGVILAIYLGLTS